MDSLNDELLIEIFHRLPPPPSSSSSSSSPRLQLSLVSKRWLRVYRLSTTSLNLALFSPHFSLSRLPSFLSKYRYLSSLSLAYFPEDNNPSSSPPPSFDELLSITACLPSNLKNLLLLGAPISPTILSHLTSSFPINLRSLTVALPRPLNFSTWLPQLQSLKTLTLYVSDHNPQFLHPLPLPIDDEPPQITDTLLPIETLTVSGINRGEVGMGWLWRSCRGRLRRLHMNYCEGVGVDDCGGAWFTECIRGVEEVELRSCRPAVEKLLADLAVNCYRLTSLLVHDGGSRDGLVDFFLNCNCSNYLRKVDFRLHLELDDHHLFAMASRCHKLMSVRLQSCTLSTGDGLKSLIISLSTTLEELSLINCDVVYKVPGLLTTLTQNLRQLKRLDLSRNEGLSDKELVSMLASCGSLVELKLRGCRRLTNASIAFLPRTCKQLESIDIMCCSGIKGKDEVMENSMLNLPRLRRVEIEEFKVSVSGRRLAESRWIEVVAG